MLSALYRRESRAWSSPNVKPAPRGACFRRASGRAPSPRAWTQTRRSLKCTRAAHAMLSRAGAARTQPKWLTEALATPPTARAIEGRQHLRGKTWRIRLQQEYAVRTFMCDRLRDSLLARHRIDRHRRTLQSQPIEQLRDRGELTEHHLMLTDPRNDDLDGALTIGSFHRASEAFAVDRDLLSRVRFAERVRPGREHARERDRVPRAPTSSLPPVLQTRETTIRVLGTNRHVGWCATPGIYAACVDFMMNVAMLLGITYRGSNALVMLIGFPLTKVVLFCVCVWRRVLLSRSRRARSRAEPS